MGNKKGFHLTILGEDGTGERYSEVINYINSNNILNVEILGKISRNDMPNYLCKMDVGVLPMITSSIPNKIFDYMAAYLPIIVLGENDSSNFVKKNQIGWNSSFNTDEIKILLNSLSEKEINKKKRNILNIRDDFSRENLHKKINKILI